MNTQIAETKVELEAVRVGIELLSKSTNALDLCRRVAHAEFMDGFCHGVAVFILDQRSVLVKVASYGIGHDLGDGDITPWDENVLSKAVRSRKVAVEETDDATIYVLPIQFNDVTTGAFMFNLSTELPSPVFSDEVIAMLSRLGGMFMESKGMSFLPPSRVTNANGEDDVVAIHELTSRQVKIIHLIADGLTNAEIAKKVLLSESTVRQETIRIFRTLKCRNRTEAIVKARAHGVISGSTPPPTN